MYHPKVSIIVPCYNQAQFLPEALQSVLNQTYENWECIIVNDGSPDNTKEVAQKWVKKDPRFIYLFKENGGLSSARNAGLNIANGDFIQFLDADDCLDERKFELSLKAVSEMNLTKPKIVISNFRMFIADFNQSSPPFCVLKEGCFTFEKMLFGWDYEFNIPIHCGFFDSYFFKNFRFNEDLKAKEDWVMWLCLFKQKLECTFINQPFAFYRIHANSMTKEKSLMAENHMNAILYVESLVSEAVYKDFLKFIVLKKNEQLINLQNSIERYKKTRSYKVAEKLKKFAFFVWFNRLMK